MTLDPNSSADPTQPVEVQRYGPPASEPPSWQSTPAWQSRAPVAPAATPRGGLSVFWIVAIAVVAGLLSGGLAAAAVANLVRSDTPSSDAAATVPQGSAVSQLRLDESSAVISAVEKVAPAVVTIQASSGGPFSATGTGSGFIYHADGWILTNEHVVAGSSELLVVLEDGRQVSGELYGVDPLTDLAIVKVDATGLTAAPIGSSAELEPGQLAIAIGNPLGNYERTVTTGVVSGLGRQIQASDATQSAAEQLNNLIQTDAAINRGNSGGPLVNSAGQVIGINTAVSTDAQGLGFAIPIDVARPIMEQAVDGEELTRPWIGVYYSLVDAQVASENDLAVDYGALVGARTGGEAVFPDSPAADAGLEEGDVIVAVDGTRVDVDHDLSSLILPNEPGDVITLRVLRDDSIREVQVTLGTLPSEE